MSFLNELQNKPLRTRWLIVIVLTIIIMSAVGYFWYVSLRNVLSGSFEVTPNQEKVAQKNDNQESFLGSLKSLFGDLDIDTSRLKEIRASMPKFSDFFNN